MLLVRDFSTPHASAAAGPVRVCPGSTRSQRHPGLQHRCRCSVPSQPQTHPALNVPLLKQPAGAGAALLRDGKAKRADGEGRHC